MNLLAEGEMEAMIRALLKDGKKRLLECVALNIRGRGKIRPEWAVRIYDQSWRPKQVKLSEKVDKGSVLVVEQAINAMPYVKSRGRGLNRVVWLVPKEPKP